MVKFIDRIYIEVILLDMVSLAYKICFLIQKLVYNPFTLCVSWKLKINKPFCSDWITQGNILKIIIKSIDDANEYGPTTTMTSATTMLTTTGNDHDNHDKNNPKPHQYH